MITFGKVFVLLCVVACLTDKALGGAIIFLNLIALLIRVVSDLEAGREPSIKLNTSDVPSFEFITHFNDPEDSSNVENTRYGDDVDDIIRPVSTASSESSYSQCSVGDDPRENINTESENKYAHHGINDFPASEDKNVKSPHTGARNGLHAANYVS